MIRLMCSPFWTVNRCLLSTQSTTFRLLHHKSDIFKSTLRYTNILQYHQYRTKKDDSKVSTLFKPVPVQVNRGDINIGAELTGNLDKGELLKILNAFTQKPEVKMLCLENGLDAFLQQQTFSSFRRYCIDAENLPTDLHIVISDILQGAGHPDDLFPYYLRFARKMFPHLECMEDLKQISDLRTPANWYPNARVKTRKIIFHAGPTNSGKTYHAMNSFMKAKTGVYCGPLKLLAAEVFHKSNTQGTPCDLVTGEERKFANADGTPSSHVACTVEMTSVTTPYEVAVIDEIQLLKDPGRGWAWTRAFLGLIADEIHVCGEAGTFELLERLCETTGEVVEKREYKRLTKLTVEDRALGSLNEVVPGDCIVCFSKNDIYSVSRQIESSGKEVAVIYGGLPPGTKLAQAAKFNDPENSCKVMVATDAIGMGLNLSIRRIIFYSLRKPTTNENGEREIDVISVSSALQIAGRAGRFGTQWENGFVTVFQPGDLQTLKELLSQQPEPITQAGLHPTAEQIELYAYHLPDSTLSNLMDIFVSLSTVDDSLYFMCNVDDFKFLAEMIQHVPLALRARYVFCCAPINRKMPFVCAMFLKYARQFSRNEPITFDFVVSNCGWPFRLPNTILELVQLEAVFDVMDLYLWLSYRFPDLFPNATLIRETQRDIDELIQQGVFQITKLLKNAEIAPANAHTVNKMSGVANAAPSKRGGSSTGTVTTNKDSYAKSADATQSMERGGGRITEQLLKKGLVTQGNATKSMERGGGRFTEHLLKKGLITEDMLIKLHKEWDRNGSNNAVTTDEERLAKKGKKGSRRKK